MKSCGCGCGIRIAKDRRFVHGHNSRVANGFQGRAHSIATKQKISDSRKGKLLGRQHPNWKGDTAGYLSVACVGSAASSANWNLQCMRCRTLYGVREYFGRLFA